MPRLTDGRSGSIASAQPANRRGVRIITDDHRDAPRGFGLRITQAGGKAFVLRYQIDGERHVATIGRWPEWTLAAARAEARELAQKITKGFDPNAAKARRRAEPKVSELAEEWLDVHASGLKSERAIRSYVRNDIVPAIGRMKVTDVRRADVVDIVQRKAEATPRAAAQVLNYARLIFEYAADKELIALNPVAGLKPSKIRVRGQRAPLKQVARGRVLTADEIRQFWTQVEAVGLSRLTALALKLILLTGQRPGEVAGMRETEIDGRWWTIPASRRGKTNQPNIVFLTDTALDVIAAARAELARLRRRRKAGQGDFIFETRPGSPLTTAAIDRAVDRKRAELCNWDDEQWGHWRPHDLRRTMRTGLSACKVRPDIAELVIGHSKRGIVAVYDLHGFDDERRAAMIEWEGRLLAIAEGHDPDAARRDNIIRLGGER